MIFIYTTCQGADNAESLSKLIINKKLAASVDYWPIKSCRTRKNNITIVEKFMITISTFEKKLEELTFIISENHKLSAPMIAGVDVRRVNSDYKEWMTQVIV
jgi:periplasmic divalent cation tolerance protein